MILKSIQKEIISEMKHTHKIVLEKEIMELKTSDEKELPKFFRSFEKKYGIHLNVEEYQIFPPNVSKKSDMVLLATWYLSHIETKAKSRQICDYAYENNLVKGNLDLRPNRLVGRMYRSGLFGWYKTTGPTGTERLWYLKENEKEV
ncbi:MAG: hypothetical protein A4E26_00125 [Methanobacterium sp. PtaU1.Bin097]|nr:MAG: hypothetical protein A4E26_00125 [Methanobacterium sp. PtaU1.Bin097]